MHIICNCFGSSAGQCAPSAQLQLTLGQRQGAVQCSKALSYCNCTTVQVQHAGRWPPAAADATASAAGSGLPLPPAAADATASLRTQELDTQATRCFVYCFLEVADCRMHVHGSLAHGKHMRKGRGARGHCHGPPGLAQRRQCKSPVEPPQLGQGWSEGWVTFNRPRSSE